MTDELLPYYNRELAFIRKMGAEFAAAHPKIAGRLRMSAETTEDPHVSRLIEAFALLAARTRHKIEDDFPEITEAMLGVLYPHYLAPIPSLAIAQLRLDEAQRELVAGYPIARHTQVETEPIGGDPCRFQTCYDVTLWPIETAEAGFHGTPFTAPTTPMASEAKAILRVKLRCLSSKVTFDMLELSSLRVYLHGQVQHAYALYEKLLNCAMGVAVARSAGDPEPVLIDAGRLRPVGFEPDETLLPYPARSFPGYQLLTEYFAFPKKFLFVDFDCFSPRVRRHLEGQRSCELYVFLDDYDQDLERNITADSLQLGCTPLANLYRQRAEPVRMTETAYEYRVIPDARRPLANEIYSVDRVIASTDEGDEVEFLPFYSLQHGTQHEELRRYWIASRRAAQYAGGQMDAASEVYLSLVDLASRPANSAGWTLDLQTTCLNRNLPQRLPFGGGQPKLQLSGGPGALVRCLTAPTATYRPPLRHGTLWRLISHLSLNHLSLVTTDENAEALREILSLYDRVDSPETRMLIGGLIGIESHRTVARVGGPVAAGFCRGIESTLHLDEENFSGNSPFLFASILDRFMALYVSLNSFSRTLVTTNKRSEVFCSWPPRAGRRVLL